MNILGTKCVDADTGLIYFKYDFGYEFGILFPGEGRKYVAGSNKCSTPMSKQFLHNSAGAIDIPVSHEQTIKQNLRKQQMRNDDSYDFMPMKNRKKFAGKNQPSVSFNLSDVHNVTTTRSRQHLPRKGAFLYIKRQFLF